MLIGIPKEIKNNENRVGLTPAGVQSLVKKGHQVLVETNAGLGSGFGDEDYAKQGATIVATAAEAWAAELVVKVKEPLAEEYDFLREDLLLFTYLHMAAAPELADAMVAAKTTGVAYETVRDQDGQLPLLVPMSEVAGRMAVQIGAHFLTKQEGGSGVLLGGVPGVPKGKVTIIGGGVVGTHALLDSVHRLPFWILVPNVCLFWKMSSVIKSKPSCLIHLILKPVSVMPMLSLGLS